MKIPVAPPKLEELMAEWGDSTTEKLVQAFSSNVGPSDDKGRYVHWEKVRHLKPPENFSSELYWLAIKQARAKISKKLPFKDKAGASFSFCMPDSVMKDVLWVVENATGAMRGDARVSDTSTKQTYLISSLIKEAISSSQLEGAATTRRVAKEMIRTGRAPKDKSEKMILNNYSAMNFIREYKHELLTPTMIFSLHEKLTEGTLSEEDAGKAGVFRDSGDDICVFSEDDVILHVPPIASELRERLQVICDFANKVDEDDVNYIPPIIRAIIVHFMIGYDHPFVDGNGRTARALFYWVMAKENYWLMEYISISTVIKKAPAQYLYAYLHTETDENDMTYFIIHQLTVIKEAVRELHDYLIGKSEELKEAERVLENSPLQGELNYRQLSVIKNALKTPGAEYTIISHQTSHGVTYQTARSDLLGLSDKFGVLKKYKIGKKDVFVAPPDLRELLRNF